MTEDTIDKPAKQYRTRTARRERWEAFARHFATPGTKAYQNATQAAIAAGYTKRSARGQGSWLKAKPDIRSLIDSISSEVAAKMAAENAVTVEYVKSEHVRQMAMCLEGKRPDRTNAREHLVSLGRMVGAYDTSLHVDLTVRQEYDERLAVEASRIARVLLEEAGSKGLGALPAATVTQEPIEAEIVEPEPSSQASEPVRVVDGLTSGEREPELVEA